MRGLRATSSLDRGAEKAAPWMAGALYDRQGGYGWALLIAGLTAMASAAANVMLPKPATRRHPASI